MSDKLFYFSLTFVFAVSLFSCDGEKDVRQIRYAKKQYYLGHDYFLKYIKALSDINSLRIKNAELSKKTNTLNLSKGQEPQLILIRRNKAEIRRNLEKIKNKTVLAERYLNAAMVELRKAVRANPEHWKAQFELGLIHLKKGTYEIDIAKRTECMKGDALREHMDKARYLLGLAKKYFLASVKDVQLKSKSYNNAAAIEIYMDNYKSAVEYAKKALDNLAYEGAFVARANMGWAYFHLKRYEDAKAQLKQVLMLQNHYCVARYRLARVYFEQKKYKKAAKEFELTINQGPPCNSIQEAYQYLGLAYLKLNNQQKAGEIFEKCVTVAPESCVGKLCAENLRILSPDTSVKSDGTTN